MAAAQLRSQYYSVDIVPNGRDAVSHFCGSPDGFYCAIVTDIRMPEMDGFEAASAIRASAHPQAKIVPIIALTSEDTPEDVSRCFRCGMNAYLAKPLNPGCLFSELKRLGS